MEDIKNVSVYAVVPLRQIRRPSIPTVMQPIHSDPREYSYSDTGNLLAVRRGMFVTQGYTYDNSTGLLTSVTGTATRNYQYDSAGNVREDGFYSFGHDRANNMRCINCTSATPMLHTYDASNMRVKSVYGADSRLYMHNREGLLLQTVNPGVEYTEHIYLGRRPVATRRVIN